MSIVHRRNEKTRERIHRKEEMHRKELSSWCRLRELEEKDFLDEIMSCDTVACGIGFGDVGP